MVGSPQDIQCTVSDNNYTSILQFMYLMEGDEGTYECNVMILETITSNIAVLTPAGR